MSCHAPVSARGGLVACAYCPGCRARRSAAWALRLEDELREWDRASFLTLTVADYPVSWPHTFDRPVPWALSKRYLQLMFKLLRRRGVNAKYYAVGEYGEKSARAHYHVICFGLDRRDRELLEEVWPWGHVDIGNVEPASVRYVTGYVMKAPLGRLREHAERSGEAPPFSVMSRGLGAGAASARHHTMVTQGIIRVGERALPPPRYYLSTLNEEGRAAFRSARRARQLDNMLQREAATGAAIKNDTLDRAAVSRADFAAKRKPRGTL